MDDIAFLGAYRRLNDDGKFFVDCALKGALLNLRCLKATPEKEMLEIKRIDEEKKELRKLKKEKSEQYFREVEAECDTMSDDDYIAKLNDIFSKLPTYKLRDFYLFIIAKLYYDKDAEVTNR